MGNNIDNLLQYNYCCGNIQYRYPNSYFYYLYKKDLYIIIKIK